MANILIMVLSSYQSPYGELMDAQNKTWNSLKVEGVETLFYSGGHPHDKVDFCGEPQSGMVTMDMQFSIRDDYYFMAGKFKCALERAGTHLYDYIFRTNSSSYVNKQRLKEFAENLPKEKLYAGWSFPDINDDGGLCVSGAGMFLSRDTAEILRDEIDPQFEMEEDVYCGRLLRKNGIRAINEKSRIDVPIVIPTNIPTDRYHYRFKTTSNRIADIGNMKSIHKIIHP